MYFERDLTKQAMTIKHSTYERHESIKIPYKSMEFEFQDGVYDLVKCTLSLSVLNEKKKITNTVERKDQ